MMHKPSYSSTYKFRMMRFAETLVLCTMAFSQIFFPTAQAAPIVANQNIPGLADTPSSSSSITYQKSLSEGLLRFQNGLAIIDSDVLMKVYYYAYSEIPIDYSAILTANTENIVPPTPVKPSNVQLQAIDRLIKIAKAHPDVLIMVDDIALDAYDKTHQSFQIVNRLFIQGARFYFDNSPYHYIYSGAEVFRTLHCTDAKTIAIINSAVADYEHFSMDIVGHVSRVISKNNAFVIELSKIALKDTKGNVLITQVKP